MTDGLVVVVRRIFHCDRRTSLPEMSMKDMVYERKVHTKTLNTKKKFHSARYINGPDVRKFQII
jgi:poly-D-alanine transfer protein DltD